MRINTPLNGEAKLQCLRHFILGLLSEKCYNDQCWEKKFKTRFVLMVSFLEQTTTIPVHMLRKSSL